LPRLYVHFFPPALLSNSIQDKSRAFRAVGFDRTPCIRVFLFALQGVDTVIHIVIYNRPDANQIIIGEQPFPAAINLAAWSGK